MSKKQSTVILWYRQDLRLTDLPALHAAARDGARVLPVYVLDDAAAGEWRPGAASRWWLHHSLRALADSIGACGGSLVLRSGDTLEEFSDLCKATGATRIVCSRRYEPWAAAQEKQLHDSLAEHGVELKRYPGSLLHEPGTVLTQGGDPFKVFTPFWRACRRQSVDAPLPVPEVRWSDYGDSDVLEDWHLLPTGPNWAEGWEDLWQPGEGGAADRLENFLKEAIADYAEDRDHPSIEGTSRLSPHLHHGEISPRQIWAICQQHRDRLPQRDDAIDKFVSELGWREFSYHLLHYFPQIPVAPFKDNFREFSWHSSDDDLQRWQQGNTGYPIVDAGMRELWQTGYMHNRVRMIVASFLCKHLLLHWREGENWFWDTLLDADLASNGCSWQWVAGSGADAAPYFRIFNPITQGEKFDKKAEYVRRFVPEIAKLPDKFIHKPWEAPAEILESAGVTLGNDYPEPIVDHRSARQAALDAYEEIKLSNASTA